MKKAKVKRKAKPLRVKGWLDSSGQVRLDVTGHNERWQPVWLTITPRKVRK